MAEQRVVVTEDLTRVFRSGFLGRKKVLALDRLTLALEPGEVLALLGPNGSGKTTCLKLLLGLLRPSAGTVRVLDRPPGHPAALARTGFMAETPAFLPLLSGEETLLLAAKVFGFDRRRRAEIVGELLQRFDLARDARRPVGEYSQGMRKRIALAQSLINDPELLLLDEPTAGLDPAFVEQVQDLVRERARAGNSVLLSSHLLSRVEEIATRVCILHRGRAVRVGTLDEVAGIEGAFDVRIRGGEQEAAVRALEDGGFSVDACRPASRSLREVFLQLTKEEGEPPDPREDA
ncbi:MAG: ABC transporter ATP-binding protein [Planctomycetota bacterium]|jgi:ABC-2 type transport system ATP-binding protein